MITEREVLRDDVIEQIKKDVESGDFTAIYELIMELPDKTLLAFLSEGSANDWQWWIAFFGRACIA